jgi:hypothetical protein
MAGGFYQRGAMFFLAGPAICGLPFMIFLAILFPQAMRLAVSVVLVIGVAFGIHMYSGFKDWEAKQDAKAFYGVAPDTMAEFPPKPQYSDRRSKKP